MPSVNEVRLMGRLVRDPEMRATPSGTAVTNFSVATSWGSGDKRTTDFHSCIAWQGKVINWAKQVAEMKQGDLVYLTGRLQTRSWETPDGEKRSKTEVVCNEVHWMRSKGSGRASNNEDDSVFPSLEQARRNATSSENEPPF